MAVNFRKTAFTGVAAKLEQCPPPDLPEIVMSGRSNVGKSSLINALADNKKLAKISQTPGKTRLVIYFNVDNQLLLTDLPGYGYAKVSQSEKERYSKLADQYLHSDRPICMVLHLLDIRHKPNQHDIQMIAWLVESGLPWQIVLTKVDKLSRTQAQKQRQEIAKFLGIDDLSHLNLVSTTKKQGLTELRELIAARVGESVADM